MSKSAPMSKSGFTIIEIVIVIAILGVVLMLVSATGFDELKKNNLRQAASKIVELSEQARSTAIKNSVDQTADWTANTFKITDQAAYKLNGVNIVTTPMTLNWVAPYGDFQRPQWMLDQNWRLDIQDSTGKYHTTVDFYGVTGIARMHSVERVGVEPK